MLDKDVLLERITSLQQRVAQTCSTAARNPEQVTLIAVTKTHPVEIAKLLLDCGISNIGENRVQEILAKEPLLSQPHTMHLIGHLQTNKVKKVVPYIQYIHSIDSVRLIDSIDACELPHGKKIPSLVEVNTTLEASKSGCTLKEHRALAEKIAASKNCEFRGFMTIGPLGGNEVAVRKAFAVLRTCAEKSSDLADRPLELSMGMSSDFEWALCEGSTMIRCGTILLGDR